MNRKGHMVTQMDIQNLLVGWGMKGEKDDPSLARIAIGLDIPTDQILKLVSTLQEMVADGLVTYRPNRGWRIHAAGRISL